VNSNPRLLLGLVSQLLSQKREFRRQSPLLRSGTFRIQHGIIRVQAVLPFSYLSTYLAGSLRSTDITPLRRYYEPRRLPTRAKRKVMHSLSPLHYECTRSGLPGSWLFVRHAPPPDTPESTPGAFARCFPGVGRLHPSWKVGHSHLCNEAESGSILAAHVFAFRGFDRRITPPPAQSAT